MYVFMCWKALLKYFEQHLFLCLLVLCHTTKKNTTNPIFEFLTKMSIWILTLHLQSENYLLTFHHLSQKLVHVWYNNVSRRYKRFIWVTKRNMVTKRYTWWSSKPLHVTNMLRQNSISAPSKVLTLLDSVL